MPGKKHHKKDHHKKEGQLDSANQGDYIDDLGGKINGKFTGSDGNVTFMDDEWEGAFASETVEKQSELEKLISVLTVNANEDGEPVVTEAALTLSLFEIGMITLAGTDAGTPLGVNPPRFGDFPGFTPATGPLAGEIELDNAIMDVGDIVNLGDGNDSIKARSGNDIVFGADGNDKLDGQDGNDALFGGADNDRLKGGKGDDYLSGGTGNDRLDGNDGNDFLSGDGGDDALKGGKGRDRIDGGDGADVITAGKGGDNDLLFLGTSASSADSLFGRDNFEDVVKSEKSFAENGTDSIFFYSDGQGTAIPKDIIDLSKAVDFGDAETAAEREAALTDAFYVIYVNGPQAEIRDLGGDGEIGGGDDNIWFAMYEDSGDTLGLSARPEVITVEVDDFTFEWVNTLPGPPSSWVEI